jgi:hypothetical protein
VPVEVRPNPNNAFYLRTKADRMGHDLDGTDLPVSTGVGDLAAQGARSARAVEKPVRGLAMAPPPEDEQEERA